MTATLSPDIMTLSYRTDEAQSSVNLGANHGANLSRMFYVPPLPRALSVCEELLQGIACYLEETCRQMVFDGNDILLRPDSTEFRNSLCKYLAQPRLGWLDSAHTMYVLEITRYMAMRIRSQERSCCAQQATYLPNPNKSRGWSVHTPRNG